MSTVFIGIDPGLDGAVACICDDGYASVEDTPTMNVGRGKVTKRVYDSQGMVARLIAIPWDSAHVVIEDVHSMPGQGVASTFTFGVGFGTWLGILAALKLPYDRVPPQRWKRAMLDGMGQGKDASRVRALQLFPWMASDLARKKDDGRAEALLMAEYARRTAGVASKCPTCNGTGRVLIDRHVTPDGLVQSEQYGPCPACRGAK